MAIGRPAGALTSSRSPDPKTASVRPVDRTAKLPTQPWRLGRATASHGLAGPALARTPANSPRDISSCTSDEPLTSWRDRVPRAVRPSTRPAYRSEAEEPCTNAAPRPGRDRKRVGRPTVSCRPARNHTGGSTARYRYSGRVDPHPAEQSVAGSGPFPSAKLRSSWRAPMSCPAKP